MSYVNVIMYNAVIPSYDSGETAGSADIRNDEVINADDPRNRDKVNKIINGC